MSDVSDRLNAALAGRYAIERPIGEGGMDGYVTNWFTELLAAVGEGN